MYAVSACTANEKADDNFRMVSCHCDGPNDRTHLVASDFTSRPSWLAADEIVDWMS